MTFQGLLAQANSVVSIPIASEKVNCVMFSPPYWGPRRYAGDEQHAAFPKVHFRLHPSNDHEKFIPAWSGDFGQEPDPDAYIGHCVLLMREVRRVLRPDGVVWFNIGDTFFGDSVGRRRSAEAFSPEWNPADTASRGGGRRSAAKQHGLSGGQKANIPGRLWLALQADGWFVRMDYIWHKTNPMPEPNDGIRWERHRINLRKAVEDWRTFARDREGVVEGAVAHVDGGQYGFRFKPEWKTCPGCPTCEPNGGYVLRNGSWRHTAAHEVVLMCAKRMNYWSDAETVKEAAVTDQLIPSREHGESHGKWGPQAFRSVTSSRNPRSVISLPTAQYKGAHFATYPPELIAPLIRSSCPRRCCPVCGRGWAPVVERTKHPTRDMEAERASDGNRTGRDDGHISGPSGQTDETYVSGYRPSCGCASGLLPDDLETISTPTGHTSAPDPTRTTGRKGLDRPRGEAEGTRPITRYEQRNLARQLARSVHRAEMETEAGPAFAHYLRTDRSGARPVPPDLLERWIGLGWIDPVTVPAGEALLPVPGILLDPFAGSGTTGEVARELGLRFIGLDLSREYLSEQARIRVLHGTPPGALTDLPLFGGAQC